MEKLLRSAFPLLLLAPFALGAQPPDIGHFKGLAFSSATDRHPVEITGGNLVRCSADRAADVTRCEVENGSVVVEGAEGNRLDVKLARVVVLKAALTRHYYFGGTTELLIGGQVVTIGARVTLNVEDATPGRVRGYIDLPDQDARTSLEAYLAP